MEVTRMNKSSVALLAKVISSKRGLKQAEAERFVAKMFEVANQALDEDKQLKVKWLGTFKVAPVKDRESVDVNTGERIVIEGRDKISFTPDNILKEIINKPFAQFDTVVVNDGIDFSDIDEKFAQMRDEEETAIKEPASEPSEEVAVEESTSEPSEEIAVEQVVGQESSLVTVSDNTSEVSLPSEEEDCASIEEPFEEVPSAEEPSAEESSEEEIQPSEEEVPKGEEVPMEEEEPMGEKAPEVEAEKFMASESASSGEEEIVSHARHFVIPKYLVAVVLVLFVVLLGGMGWLAFNYGKMQAQRDHLAAQLVLAQKKQPIRVEKKKSVPPVPHEDSVQAALKVKAKEDSVRLAASSEAVKLAEKAEKTEKEQVTATTESSDKYNGDPRVRTGAYRIVGVAQTVTVSSGQTLESLSKRYLGAGMECYVEALNGTSGVKEGQKLKIPKLELKRKAK